jgi:ATP-binding protein involved in chromosome partitioning
MPPGTDRFETLLRLVPGLSGVLAVTIPSQVSHLVVRRSITAAKQAGAPLLGLVENMAGLTDEAGDITGELFPGGEGETFAAQMGIPYLGKIPFDGLLSRTTDGGRPFILEHAQRPAGQAILSLARKIEESL